MKTTTVAKSAGCSLWCMGASLNTLASAMSLRSRIPTSTVCKENKRGKHAQTHCTRRHGQSTCRQVPDMRARRARASRGVARASNRHAQTNGFVDVGLCRRRLFYVVFVETYTMHTAKHSQVDCMWITRGVVLYRRLVAAARQPAACRSVA